VVLIAERILWGKFTLGEEENVGGLFGHSRD
jgi:hypothetical protein